MHSPDSGERERKAKIPLKSLPLAESHQNPGRNAIVIIAV